MNSLPAAMTALPTGGGNLPGMPAPAGGPAAVKFSTSAENNQLINGLEWLAAFSAESAQQSPGALLAAVTTALMQGGRISGALPHNAGQPGAGGRGGTLLPLGGAFLPPVATLPEPAGAMTLQHPDTPIEPAPRLLLPAAWSAALQAGDAKAPEPLPATGLQGELAENALLQNPKSPGPAAPARGNPQLSELSQPLTFATQPQFERAVGQRLMLMLGRGNTDARIRLHPENLGSLDIQLQMDGDEARVFMLAPSASVRDALELAVPRLRELLNDAGLLLTQVDVGAGHSDPAGSFGREQAQAAGDHSRHLHDESVISEEPGRPIRVPTRLVDIFA